MLETSRCILFNLQQDDYEDIKKLYENEEVRKYLGGTWKEELIKASFSRRMQSTNNELYWVVREKQTHQFIGLISLDTHHDGHSTEVSYQLLPSYWGAGFGTELVKAIIHYAFSKLNLTEIVAETQTANTASCRLLEKLGMTLKETVQRFGAEQSIYFLKNSL